MHSTPDPRPADNLIPPPEPRAVYRTGLMGVGFALATATLGLFANALGDSAPAVLNTARLALAAVGLLTAGVAVSRRPGLWAAWAIAAGACLVAATLGVPAAWDSGRLLARVATGVFAAGAVLAALPLTLRLSVASLAVVFHFTGILCAVTWPTPTPWLTNQVGYRVYMPYLTFLYLRNAYQFYSPEPGPASLLVCLLKYELDRTDPATGKPEVVREWVSLPRRDQHMKDPLGQTYYRRLSITEMTAAVFPGAALGTNYEKLDVFQRRQRAGVVASGGAKEPIPLGSGLDDTPDMQYKVPQETVSRYLLPSYAAHLADEFSAPGRTVVSLKMYRVEHRILPTNLFAKGDSPYHPGTYRPYYYGEYDAAGTLLNPQDEMLYWLVPVAPKRGGASPADPTRRDYVDYLSKHAGFEFDWSKLRP